MIVHRPPVRGKAVPGRPDTPGQAGKDGPVGNRKWLKDKHLDRRSVFARPRPRGGKVGTEVAKRVAPPRWPPPPGARTEPPRLVPSGLDQLRPTIRDEQEPFRSSRSDN